jgi:hypothetical protein
VTEKDVAAAQARAEASFRKKEESRAAAAVVMAEVEARKQAELAKTARLRALRLEKEAADQVATALSEAGQKPKAARRRP